MLQNIGSAIKHILRHIHRTKDKNFIGFDKYQKHGAYHWEELKHNESYRKKLETVASFVHSEYICLDIGCGDGAYIYALSNKCENIIGVDADYDAVRLANSKLKEKAATNCRCIQIPISQVTLQALNVDSQFDLVYSMDVIEHLPDPYELLQVAAGIVKSHGLVLIGTPIFLNAELVSPYHVKEFTVQEMQDMVSCHFHIKQEIILPMLRTDGKIYDDGFYISVGTPTAK
jgi:2-polyprenyl-3-methyl-5-hydroxy-6-metoxy-1,4-benzoquinol methylase